MPARMYYLCNTIIHLRENVKKIELQFSDSVFYDEIHVNITGGTKIMSIACYEVFKNKENTVLYYQPVNKPVQILNSKIRKPG